jgi:hypothetical protein
MGSDTSTYLQNSEVWNILEVYKLKNSLANKYKRLKAWEEDAMGEVS